MPNTLRRLLPVAGAVLGLVLLGWIVSSAGVTTHSTPVPTFAPAEEPSESRSSEESRSPPPLPTGEAAPQQSQPPPAWLETAYYVLIGLLIAGVVALAGYLAYRYLSNPPTGWDRVDTTVATRASAREMREAVRAGLSDIDSGDDPRAAVIACWLRLERVAAAAGIARLEGETPTDLVSRVLAEHQVDETALSRLATAYHRARYAPQDVGEELRDTARTALRAVDTDLRHVTAEREAT